MPKITQECGWCGQPFVTNSYRVRMGRGRYCSKTCYYEGRKATPKDLSSMYTVDPETGCWNWIRNPGSRYPKIRVDGKTYSVHVYMWEQASGIRLDWGQVHHKCGNTRCANPDHLIALPTVTHARVHRATVTRSDAAAIRKSTERTSVLAARYGVAPSTICDIRSGRTWKDV